MTTVVAGVIEGAAMAAGGWAFVQVIQINKVFHRIHKHVTKLELNRG